MRLAIVHDFLAQNGGAERVLKAFSEIWPTAPIFVLFHDFNKVTGFNPNNIKESFLAKLPFIKNKYRWYLPLMPYAIKRHNLSNFDVILSSSSSFAKAATPNPNALHICYCYTPARYLWGDSNSYVNGLPLNYLIKKIILPPVLNRLRYWDKQNNPNVHHFVAISNTVKDRIKNSYGRESQVIYPPVDVAKFSINSKIDNYFAAGGRLVPHKKFDIVIKVFNRLKLPLKIFGGGSEFTKLKKMSAPNIQFLGYISDEQKTNLLSRARALIHPQIEDFGITALEAAAAGRPVIAYNQGGATETVVSGITGTFFNQQTWESLLDSVLNFNDIKWDSEKIRAHAQTFDVNNFKTNIKNFVEQKYTQHVAASLRGGLKADVVISKPQLDYLKTKWDCPP